MRVRTTVASGSFNSMRFVSTLLALASVSAASASVTPSTCDSTACQKTVGGQFACVSGVCQVYSLCYAGFVANSDKTACSPTTTLPSCTDDSQCPQPQAGGYGECNGAQCIVGCFPGYFKQGITCQQVPFDNYPRCGGQYCYNTPANATQTCNSRGACDFTCKSGFVKSSDGNSCVTTAITPVPTCDPTKCPSPGNGGQATCVDNKCSIVCVGGTHPFNGACVPDCDLNTCIAPNNAKPVCNAANNCDFTCDAGYLKNGTQCVTTAITPIPTCVKKPIAFYLDYQTTANGQPAIQVNSIVDCAAECVAQDCASFDFWDGNQCGLQLKSQGGSFDGFQPSIGTIHGVPGSCSNYTEPGYCWNDSFCASDAVRSPTAARRHRMIRRLHHEA